MTVKKFIWPLAVLVLAVLLGALSVRAQNDLPEYTIISEEGTENECDEIGIWDATSKTCTLTDDVSGRVEIFESGVTFDGAGYTLSGRGEGYGMEFFGGEAVLENLTVQNFSDALALYGGTSTVRNVQVQNSSGVGLEVFGENSVVENTTIENFSSGVKVYEGRSTVKNVELSQGEVIGLVSYGDNTTVEDISVKDMQNGYGLRVFGENTDVKNVRVRNVMNGVYAAARTVSFSGLDLQGGTGKGLHVISVAEVANFRIENFNTGVAAEGENMSFSNGTLRGNNTAMRFDGEEFFVTAMNFIGSFEQDVFMDLRTVLFYEPPKFIGNYWDKYDEPAEGCEDPNQDGICNLPYDVLPFSLFRERVQDRAPQVRPIGEEQKPEPECTENCFSNVAFLPGIQASRLYRETSDDDEDQLWEPQRHQDVRQLSMNENGRSADSNIYTRDIIDESLRIINGPNVYKNFALFMDDVSGENALIKEWKPIPYDWRISLSRLLETGTKTGSNISYQEKTETPYIISEIRKLAESSKTGKVTIVAHSNGGLLTKLLLHKLEVENDPLLQKIDKVILVASPQLGTPKAIGSLLHGDGQVLGPFGIIVDRETARTFGENVIPGYGLLPSQKYFDVVDTPVLHFSEEAGDISVLSDLADTNISSYELYKDFLLGQRGAWQEPANDATDVPNVLDEDFITQAENLHNTLDAWSAPENIAVTQIVGWGLDTTTGITYDNCDIPFCPNTLNHLDRELEQDVAGDGTVLAPSAAAMEGAETYYVKLDAYNNDSLFNRTHASILETEPTQKLVETIIKGKGFKSEYVTQNTSNLNTKDSRLRYSMHSPVSVDLYTKDGLHTGLVENSNTDFRVYEAEIPNSYYKEFGEGKYLGSPVGEDITIKLDGTGTGTFTFKITKVENDEEVQTITYRDVPVTPEMEAQIQLRTLDDRSALKIDMDGDGATDFSLNGSREVIEEPEEKRDPVEYMELVWASVENMNLNFGVEKCISTYFKYIQYQREQGASGSQLQNYIDDLIFQLENFESSGYLSEKNLEVLKNQLDILKELIE